MSDPPPTVPSLSVHWRVLVLLPMAVTLADLPFDVGPELLLRERPGAASGIGPLYWAMHLGYGVLLGLLLMGPDRAFRRRRMIGWALALGLGALLFSPEGVMYFANAFEFGGELALQGLAALWPMACGWALVGGLLAWALERSRRLAPALLLGGLAAGAFGWLVSMLLASVNPAQAGFQVAATLLPEGGRWCVEGALIGLALALALSRPAVRR